MAVSRSPQDQWDAVAQLVEQASSLEPALRVAFIGQATADQHLRQEVLELLATADRADFLDQPAALPAPPSQAGDCRLIRLLGEGGMGSVYEAVRTLASDSGVLEQRVAVKLWHPEAGDPRNFLVEASALARLNHPGIARLLDTGYLENGAPYLVMELVEGSSLTEFCAGKSLAQKLELLGRVLLAVGAAHRALIAHRDIKPANILVTADGTPKLVDFGISRTIDDAETTVHIRLSPRYASPEQLTGGVVTAATDIYSFGTTMYEVLTGRHPFADTPPAGLLRAICEGPVPASALPTDLASIVLKAMAKNPEHRYSSAEALADDIEKYTKGEPVSAVEATWGYRARKYAARRKVPLAVAAVVTGLVTFACGRAYWEARNAARRFDQVHKLAHSLVFEIHDEVSKVKGTLASRKLILARAIEYLDQLANDRSADRTLQRELAESYVKVALAQASTQLGTESEKHFKDAKASYFKAVNIFERLDAGSSPDRQLRTRYALALERAAGACEALEQPCPEFRVKARSLLAAEARAHPGDWQAQAHWLQSRIPNSTPRDRKKIPPVRDELRAVAEAYDELAKRFPNERRLDKYVAYSFKRLGGAESRLGQHKAAIEWYQRAREIHTREGELLGLSICDVDLAWNLQELGKSVEALASYDRALETRRSLVRAAPGDRSRILALASVLHRRAATLAVLRRWKESIAGADEVVALLGPLEGEAAQDPSIVQGLAKAYEVRGSAFWGMNDKANAVAAYRKMLAFPPDVHEGLSSAALVEETRRRVSSASGSGKLSK